jgi:hypothetical protein
MNKYFSLQPHQLFDEVDKEEKQLFLRKQTFAQRLNTVRLSP